ncbi:MAG: S41 family peptidase [Patescibacteria group bacterium]
MDQFKTFANNQSQKSTWEKSGRFFVWGLLVILAFFVGLGVGVKRQQPAFTSEQIISQASDELASIFGQNSGVNISLFKEVWDTIHQNYFDKGQVKDQALFYGALAGMVDALGDPHSVFFDPKSTKDFAQELKGSFDGIGAEIGRRDGLLVIVAPLSGSPAEKAGLKAGDKILAIDSKDATEFSIDQAISLIRGNKGTKVTLTVLSNGENKTKNVTIVRAKIDVPSVTYRLEDSLALIKVSNFNEETDGQFAKVVQKVLVDNPNGIILDLRNNPGGFLETAVSLTSYWLEPGQVVVREEFADKSLNQTHQAVRKPSLSRFKTIVLVNEGSASASEILAGALKDYALATLIGQKTYGKGSVQQLIPLSDQTSVKITVAKWLTPKGNTIDGTGISPDIEVDLTADDYNQGIDPQLDKAKELLKQ